MHQPIDFIKYQFSDCLLIVARLLVSEVREFDHNAKQGFFRHNLFLQLKKIIAEFDHVSVRDIKIVFFRLQVKLGFNLRELHVLIVQFLRVIDHRLHLFALSTRG